jgi:UrcA family protein
MTHSLKILLLAGAFGACAMSLPANAQTYGGGDGYYAQAPEEVIIRAPRYHAPQRSTIGAPIRDVAISEPVRFDDLDLNSDHDVRRLESRVRERAGNLCRRLDVTHPITVSDGGPSCYREAVADAMDQVDAAIDQARGYDRDGDYRSDTFVNPPPPRHDRYNAGNDDNGY